MPDKDFHPWNLLRSRSMRYLLGCGILLVLAAAAFCVADAWVEWPKKPAVRPREPWLDDPAVVALLGYGFDLGGVDQVLVVRAYPPVVVRDESVLRNLEGFKWLTTLKLRSQKAVTGAGLQYIAHLSNLNTIDLSGCSIDDRGLKHLEKLGKLRCLHLEECPITDDGLKSLAEPQDLRWIRLSRTHISDKGLAEIGSLVHLWELVLDGTSITDEGLQHLTRLQELRELSLDETRVSDAGLKHLQSLESLKSLRLSGTRVAGAGLKHLRPLTRLEWLSLRKTTVSPAQARELQQILPGAVIFLETGTLHERGRWEPNRGARSEK